ncbi:hypothetical protein NJL88_26685 [Streptomyces sp. DK15]|uniref:hypothetical protein n=1 Tax=Streptomyces sp. DK15 TaxID=2957499 RepID=UPI0029BCD9F9|nr:hypothetical protein [Streptomyces sp. DK15]MDX2393581.1 hypothetical protein [Streptomyces sp. DK15]
MASYVLKGIRDGLLSLVDDDLGNTIDDLALPSGELSESIQSQFDEGKALRMSVLTAMWKQVVDEATVTNEGQ